MAEKKTLIRKERERNVDRPQMRTESLSFLTRRKRSVRRRGFSLIKKNASIEGERTL